MLRYPGGDSQFHCNQTRLRGRFVSPCLACLFSEIRYTWSWTIFGPLRASTGPASFCLHYISLVHERCAWSGYIWSAARSTLDSSIILFVSPALPSHLSLCQALYRTILMQADVYTLYIQSVKRYPAEQKKTSCATNYWSTTKNVTVLCSCWMTSV